jgi:hypothetical protein
LFTRKASLYFELASVLLVVGLFLQDWQLASMVLPLASLFFLSNFFGIPEKVELDVSHQVIPSDSFGEDDISVQVKVSNKRGDLLGNVEVGESLPNAILLEKGVSRVLTQLGSRETVELLLEFHSPW